MKAQYFSFDVMIASIIFVLSFTLLFSFWSQTQSIEQTKDNNIANIGLKISNTLLTAGNPPDWTNFPIQIGLYHNSTDPRVYENKVDWLINYNYSDKIKYNRLKENLGCAGYDIGFSFEIYNSSSLIDTKTAHLPPSNASNVYIITRSSPYCSSCSGQTTKFVKIKIYLWK